MADMRGAFDLSFREQITYFRGKTNVPTAAWDDLLGAEHDRAFVVAGAMKADLLDDLRRAVDQGIAQGTGLDQFRAQFREIVQRHGWHGWTGEDSAKGEAWRTRVIFETNLRASYAAGRYAQLTDPELLARCPYWQYLHNDGAIHPRDEHKAWGDAKLTLPHDHPFWQTHYPPNGWGCGCTVRAARAPANGAQTAPPENWDKPNPKTGAPPGIDKGWDYAPGATRADELREIIEDKAAKLPEPLKKDFTSDMTAKPRPPVSAPAPVSVDDFITAGRKITQGLGDEINRLSLMAKLRDEVGTGTACKTITAGEGTALVRAVSKNFPATWVQKANEVGPLSVALRSDGRGWAYTISPDIQPGRRVQLPAPFGVVIAERNAGYIITNNSAITAAHEFTHRLQSAMPELDALFQNMHRRRTRGNPFKRLRDLVPACHYGSDERTKEDHYIDPYWGKEYDGGALEVMTMSMQTVIGGKDFKKLYNKDREMFDFIVGLLFHWKP